MSRPLRVLVFLHSFEAGGVERVALRLCGAWAALGTEVHIAMGRPGGALADEAPAGAPIVLPRRAPRFVRHFESLWLVPHLVSEVRRVRPDVLFCAGNTYAIVSVLARLILGAACPPIVCKISNTLDRRDFPAPVRWGYGAWLRLQTRFIDLFVGLSAEERAELRAFLKVPDDRIAVVPDPALSLSQIGRAPVREPDRASQGRTFVGVGRLVRQKGFDVLIEAFAACPGEDRLTILGDGPERARLEALARRLGVEDRVLLPGHAADAADQLARADALILSSRYEGVPAVLLEALAKGVPVIATDCSASIRPLLRDGAFGEVVAVEDATALAAAMGRVGAHAYDVAAMMAQARDFTVERSAPRYLRLFEKASRLAAKAPAPAGARPEEEARQRS